MLESNKTGTAIKIAFNVHKKLTRYKAYKKESFSKVIDRIARQLEKDYSIQEIKKMGNTSMPDKKKQKSGTIIAKSTKTGNARYATGKGKSANTPKQRKQKIVAGGTGEIEQESENRSSSKVF